jgi:hypothetical protein
MGTLMGALAATEAVADAFVDAAKLAARRRTGLGLRGEVQALDGGAGPGRFCGSGDESNGAEFEVNAAAGISKELERV